MNSTTRREDWVDRDQYPFVSRFYAVPAGRMHYLDEGNGQPVVMLHGNPAWSFLYRHLIRQLRDEYRCIAPDHIGFGLSDKPEGWSYLPRDHSENLTSLLDELKVKNVTLVMQDWGGPIGMAYAVAHPENIAGLVILNTWSWPVDRDWYYRAFSGFMGGPVGRMLIRRRNFFATSVMKQAFGVKEKLTPAVHAQYLQALGTPAERKGCMVFPRQIIHSTAWLAGIWSRVSVLENLPALIVWGMKDIAFREKELQRWQRAFPRARTLRLEEAGHFVQEEAPEELFEAMLPFLRETCISGSAAR